MCDDTVTTTLAALARAMSFRNIIHGSMLSYGGAEVRHGGESSIPAKVAIVMSPTPRRAGNAPRIAIKPVREMARACGAIAGAKMKKYMA